MCGRVPTIIHLNRSTLIYFRVLMLVYLMLICLDHQYQKWWICQKNQG